MARFPWTPGTGDLVRVRVTAPQASTVDGVGAAGHRPALVLSPAAFSARTKVAIVCPIAAEVRGYPFEVALPPGLPVSGDPRRSRHEPRSASLPGPAAGDVARRRGDGSEAEASAAARPGDRVSARGPESA